MSECTCVGQWKDRLEASENARKAQYEELLRVSDGLNAARESLRRMSDKAMALEADLAEEREGRLTDLKELVIAALGAE